MCRLWGDVLYDRFPCFKNLFFLIFILLVLLILLFKRFSWTLSPSSSLECFIFCSKVLISKSFSWFPSFPLGKPLALCYGFRIFSYFIFLRTSIAIFCHFLLLPRLSLLFILVSGFGFEVGGFPQVMIITTIYWMSSTVLNILHVLTNLILTPSQWGS